jgi:hypothetical protein
MDVLVLTTVRIPVGANLFNRQGQGEGRPDKGEAPGRSGGSD